ncbi:MAG: NRDE family protein, partial [Pseudomonadota bacterium]
SRSALRRTKADAPAMCTVILSIAPDDPWPVVFAGNRDETRGRAARPPGRWWPDRPDVRAGFDVVAGGSWLGLNDQGVMACVLNRAGALGPAPGKRSRGELVLEALDHADAADAADAIADIDPAAYRPFNFVVADNRDAFWIALAGETATPRVERLPPGLSMITAHDRNSGESHRQRRWRPVFEAAPRPTPDDGLAGWAGWTALLRGGKDVDAPPKAAMLVDAPDDFGTVSSALVALPAMGSETPPHFLFADGPPDRAAFEPVPYDAVPSRLRIA